MKIYYTKFADGVHPTIIFEGAANNVHFVMTNSTTIYTTNRSAEISDECRDGSLIELDITLTDIFNIIYQYVEPEDENI